MTAIAIPTRAPARTRRSSEGRRGHAARPELAVVERSRRSVGRRSVLAIVASLAVLALFTVVAFHALLAQSQVAIDRLEQETAEAERRYEQARFEHAALASPERIVQRAQELGLVPPAGPPTPVAVEGDLPTPPEGTAPTLRGWTEVKPTLADVP